MSCIKKIDENPLEELPAPNKNDLLEYLEDIGLGHMIVNTPAPHEIEKDLELKKEKIQILERRVKTLQNKNGFLIHDHTRISGQLERLPMLFQLLKSKFVFR